MENTIHLQILDENTLLQFKVENSVISSESYKINDFLTNEETKNLLQFNNTLSIIQPISFNPQITYNLIDKILKESIIQNIVVNHPVSAISMSLSERDVTVININNLHPDEHQNESNIVYRAFVETISNLQIFKLLTFDVTGTMKEIIDQISQKFQIINKLNFLNYKLSITSTNVETKNLFIKSLHEHFNANISTLELNPNILGKISNLFDSLQISSIFLTHTRVHKTKYFLSRDHWLSGNISTLFL